MDYHNQLNAFWNFNCDAFPIELSEFRSFQGRIFCFKTLLQKICRLPFSLILRALLTLFRVVGFGLGVAFFIGTFGSPKSQEFFFKRSSKLASDVTEWIVFPFIVIIGLFRLLVGSTLHPAIYLR